MRGSWRGAVRAIRVGTGPVPWWAMSPASGPCPHGSPRSPRSSTRRLAAPGLGVPERQPRGDSLDQGKALGLRVGVCRAGSEVLRSQRGGWWGPSEHMRVRRGPGAPRARLHLSPSAAAAAPCCPWQDPGLRRVCGIRTAPLQHLQHLLQRPGAPGGARPPRHRSQLPGGVQPGQRDAWPGGQAAR